MNPGTVARVVQGCVLLVGVAISLGWVLLLTVVLLSMLGFLLL